MHYHLVLISLSLYSLVSISMRHLESHNSSFWLGKKEDTAIDMDNSCNYLWIFYHEKLLKTHLVSSFILNSKSNFYLNLNLKLYYYSFVCLPCICSHLSLVFQMHRFNHLLCGSLLLPSTGSIWLLTNLLHSATLHMSLHRGASSRTAHTNSYSWSSPCSGCFWVIFWHSFLAFL